MICDDFRLNVQAVLDERNWPRTRLATVMGVTPGYVTQILNGHREPGLRVVERVADALDTPVARLLERRTPRRKKTG